MAVVDPFVSLRDWRNSLYRGVPTVIDQFGRRRMATHRPCTNVVGRARLLLPGRAGRHRPGRAGEVACGQRLGAGSRHGTRRPVFRGLRVAGKAAGGRSSGDTIRNLGCVTQPAQQYVFEVLFDLSLIQLLQDPELQDLRPFTEAGWSCWRRFASICFLRNLMFI